VERHFELDGQGRLSRRLSRVHSASALNAQGEAQSREALFDANGWQSNRTRFVTIEIS